MSRAAGHIGSLSLTWIRSIPWDIMVMTLLDELWHGHSLGMCWAMSWSAALLTPVWRVPFLFQRMGSVWISLWLV
eukprot:4162682-Heterocapsa_arctica.AAC.1